MFPSQTCLNRCDITHQAAGMLEKGQNMCAWQSFSLIQHTDPVQTSVHRDSNSTSILNPPEILSMWGIMNGHNTTPNTMYQRVLDLELPWSKCLKSVFSGLHSLTFVKQDSLQNEANMEVYKICVRWGSVNLTHLPPLAKNKNKKDFHCQKDLALQSPLTHLSRPQKAEQNSSSSLKLFEYFTVNDLVLRSIPVKVKYKTGRLQVRPKLKNNFLNTVSSQSPNLIST